MNEKHAKAIRFAMRARGLTPSEALYSDRQLPPAFARNPMSDDTPYVLNRFIRTLKATCGRGFYQSLKRAMKRSK
jgi:hypothetical protein